MWRSRQRTRQWVGNPSLAQLALATGITIICVSIVTIILSFMIDGVPFPLAAILIVGGLVVQIFMIRLLTRRTR